VGAERGGGMDVQVRDGVTGPPVVEHDSLSAGPKRVEGQSISRRTWFLLQLAILRGIPRHGLLPGRRSVFTMRGRLRWRSGQRAQEFANRHTYPEFN
jgi:hypothetical protein